jgi:hypothetical protein
MTFLVTEFGKLFTSNGFGNRFRKWCDEAQLPHVSAHGLRKAGASIAAENGATERQLTAIFGWSTLRRPPATRARRDRKSSSRAQCRCSSPFKPRTNESHFSPRFCAVGPKRKTLSNQLK